MGIPFRCRALGPQFLPQRSPREVFQYLSLAMNHTCVDTFVYQVGFPKSM